MNNSSGGLLSLPRVQYQFHSNNINNRRISEIKYQFKNNNISSEKRIKKDVIVPQIQRHMYWHDRLDFQTMIKEDTDQKRLEHMIEISKENLDDNDYSREKQWRGNIQTGRGKRM